MARTRNASHNFHQDDGIALGKGGEPLMVNPMRARHDPSLPAPLDRQGNYVSPAAATIAQPRNIAGNVTVRGPGAEAAPPVPAVIGYRADSHSWSRNMEAWELARLLDMAFRNPGELGEGFVIEVTEAEYNRMEGNLRRHFMAVRG